MSQQVLHQRAASIRQTWSNRERQQRAVASDLRCLDLLIRLATGRDFRTVKCHVRTSA